MRARDHEKIVKTIRREHAQEMKDIHHAHEALSAAIQFRHGLIELYEGAIYDALESGELSDNIKAFFKRVSEMRDTAFKLYGEGADINEVLAAME